MLLALAALALYTASASALFERGHVFCASCSFGSTGAGPGQFSGPTGIAVNEKSGDVYVADTANKRVERFTTTGEKGQAPIFASEFSGTALKSPQAIAVDNSHSSGDPSAGDVYVVDGANVDKFSSQGVFIRHVTSHAEKEEFETPLGVAVDASGFVWVYWNSAAIVSFNNAEVNQRRNLTVEGEEVESLEASEATGELRRGFAIDANDNFYVGHEPNPAFEEEKGEEPCEKAPCAVAKFDSQGLLLLDELDTENTSAVAVDLSNGDAYLNNLTSIAEFSPNGTLIQRIGSGVLQRGSGVAVSAKTGNVYGVDAAANKVDVFEPEPPGPPTVDGVSAVNITSESVDLRASIDATGAETSYTFQYGTVAPLSCPPPVSPSCEGEAPIPAANLGSGFGNQVASLHLSLLRAGTVYHFRVLASNSLGSVTSQEGTFTTQSSASGLTLLDGRQWEMVSPPDKQGAGIVAIRREGGAIQASADGSAITYVANAPIVSHPEGNRNPDLAQVLSSRGAKEWSSQDLATPNDSAQALEAAHAQEYLLFSSSLSLGALQPFGARSTGVLAEPPLSPQASPGEVRERTIYLRIDQSISPEASQTAIYNAAKSNGEAMNNPGYLALVTAVNDTASPREPFGNELTFLSATPDLTHVVFRSNVALTSDAPSGEGLYEWTEGQLRRVSVLPDGTAATNVKLGGGNNFRHAISDDGSRVVFGTSTHLYTRDTTTGQTAQIDGPQSGAGEGPAGPAFQTASADGSKVYFTDQQKLTTDSGSTPAARDLYECEVTVAEGKLHCSLSDLTPVTPSKELAAVQGIGLSASEDGSRIYFVANAVLDSATNSQNEGATPGNCAIRQENEEASPNGAKCNLYTRRPDPENPGQFKTTFVASLANEDAPDWESRFGLNDVTSRVSPSGRYLAFMSDRRLTGYDNTDANSPGGEARADEEVFLYDAETGSLVCASCNPSGARPVGVLDTEEAGEGQGLLVDRTETWKGKGSLPDRWLAGSVPGWTPTEFTHALYQSRYLSDSGRLFFNSADALASQDTNGKEDVYEYEPQGVPGGEHGCTSSSATFAATSGGCVALISSGKATKESAFLDASVSGGDVFFLTTGALLPQDFDTSFDVYDAHECTGQAPCLPPAASAPAPPCGSEACKSATSSQPAIGAPASAGLSGSGNLAPPSQSVLPFKAKLTRAQLLAKSLKACKKLKSKKKRAACRSRANKRYGVKKHKSAKRSSHGTRH